MPTRPAAYAHGEKLYSKQGIYEVDSVQRFPLGEGMQLGDRSFYYAQANASNALIAGDLIEGAALAGGTSYLQTACPIAVAAPAGVTDIYINSITAAQAAGLFDDGWCGIYDASPGCYYTYRIRTNLALATTGVTGKLTLYDELHIALTTSDYVKLTTNRYKSVVIANYSTPTSPALGVAPVAVPVSNFFWLQTWGPCHVLISSAALTAGYDVVRSNAVDGAVISQIATTGSLAVDRVGTCMNIGTASYGALIDLQIRP